MKLTGCTDFQSIIKSIQVELEMTDRTVNGGTWFFCGLACFPGVTAYSCVGTSCIQLELAGGKIYMSGRALPVLNCVWVRGTCGISQPTVVFQKCAKYTDHEGMNSRVAVLGSSGNKREND